MEQQTDQTPPAANDDPITLLERTRETVVAIEQSLSDVEERKARLNQILEDSQARLDELTQRAAAVEALKSQTEVVVDSARTKATELETGVVEVRSRLDQATNDWTTTIQTKVTQLDNAAADARSRFEQSANELAQSAQAKLSELTATLQQAQADQQAVSNTATSAAQQSETIQQALATVESLRSEITNHHATTQEAQAAKEALERDASSALTRINENLDDARTQHKEFAEACAKSEEEIERITKQAESMLFAATNAGLATAFNNEVKKLEGQMLWATGLFVLGIVGLVGSLVPLYIFMSQIIAGHTFTPTDLAVGVFMRAALIFPAGLFCYHFQKRTMDLFRLRQQYVHKATLCQSIEPFRRQAGDHAADAIAGVLREILKNPASAIERGKKNSSTDDAIQALIARLDNIVPIPPNH